LYSSHTVTESSRVYKLT